ncbi:MAG TPA: acetylxylan esterase, partial [Elusimicrobia bacterium]|nr:acetylxylan esterase [Elusimicrobiota bacterium]
VYPFLAQYLGLDLSKVVNPDGSLREAGIVIEDQEALFVFDEKHPFPQKGIRNHHDVVWN